MNLPTWFKKHDIIANVIWANCERDIDMYVVFRKKFVTENETCSIKIFADTYYNLYVDGSFIHRGPVRRHENTAEYDKLSLCLEKGEHTVAVLVHHLGAKVAGHRTGEKNFWCEIETENGTIISDESWKAKYLDAMITDGRIFSHYDYVEDIDMKKFPKGFMNPDFDDSNWENALVLFKAESENDIHKNYRQRTMKLFSYLTEKGELMKTGTFKDMPVEGPHYSHKFFGRVRDQETNDGNYYLYKFEKTISGTIKVEYECEDDSEIIIGYDDQLTEDGFVKPNRWIRYADRFLTEKGRGEAEILFPRGFMYVLLDASKGCKILNVTAIKEVYPYEEKKSFFADNKLLNDIFDVSVRTQQVCTIDGFTDCVNRERVLWLGDAYFDCMGNYYSTFDKGLLLTTIYEHAMGRSEKGALGGYNSSNMRPNWLLMPSYNLMYLEMVIDYLLYTGDEINILPLKDTIKGIIKYILSNINEKGVFDTEYVGCSNYWDWGYSEPDGENVKFGAYFAFIVDRMKELDFFNDIITPEILVAVEKIREVSHEIFFDKEKKVYRDTSCSKLTTQAATSYAVLGNIKGSENYKELFNNITDEKMLDAIPIGENQENENGEPDLNKILPAATMYGATVTARTMFIKGLYSEGLKYLTEVWGEFAHLPTLPELRRNGANNTACHGWSASPAYLLPMYILGIRPLKEGYNEALFQIPNFENNEVTGANGSVITPKGEIKAAYTKYEGFIKADVFVPKDIKLTVKYKEKEYLLIEGANTVYIKA